MPITGKIAYQLYIIIFANLFSAIVLFSFSYYIYLKAKKTPLLKSYLTIVFMILIWMVAKIFKSVAPTIQLRWFFIVVQYFGVAYLSYALLNFSLVYHLYRPITKKAKSILLIFPTLFFLIVMTNPLHMKFYSSFDFYNDSFGDYFYPFQIISYLYLLATIIILTLSKANESKSYKKGFWGYFLAILTILSLGLNFYYVLFKLDVFNWIFTFPVFDITPIAISISFILFMLPVIKFRFFDISPVSYWKSFQNSHQGIAFFDQNYNFINANPKYNSFFGDDIPITLLEKSKKFDTFYYQENKKHFKVTKKSTHQNSIVLYIENQTKWLQGHTIIKNQNELLKAYPETLTKLENEKTALALTQTKSSIAQNMHDILGHSLTVVIGYCEWIQKQHDLELISKKWTYIKELLMSSLNDLRNTFQQQNSSFGTLDLVAAIEKLKDAPIKLDFSVQGQIKALSPQQTECLYRLCQESITNAIKHGQATKLDIIFRYKNNTLTFYLLDNGKGCQNIIQNYGLKGIKERISKLDGEINFSSDGETGFVIQGHFNYNYLSK